MALCLILDFLRESLKGHIVKSKDGSDNSEPPSLPPSLHRNTVQIPVLITHSSVCSREGHKHRAMSNPLVIFTHSHMKEAVMPG